MGLFLRKKVVFILSQKMGIEQSIQERGSGYNGGQAPKLSGTGASDVDLMGAVAVQSVTHGSGKNASLVLV